MTEKVVHIEKISPPLGSSRLLYMLEPFSVVAWISTHHAPQNIMAEIWTNAINKINPGGSWHAVSMHLNPQPSNGLLEFQGFFLPTGQGTFEYTVRLGFRENGHPFPLRWQWGSDYGQNGKIIILPPSPDMSWTQGPQAIELAPGVYVGNYIAASQAPDLGFQAVLNMAEELNLTYPATILIDYKKIGLPDGAHNPIPPEKILEAVLWIQQKLKEEKRVIVNCRAGIGRSGSVGIAYLYLTHPDWSYNHILEFAWSRKSNIYPHEHLKETLESLFPR